MDTKTSPINTKNIPEIDYLLDVEITEFKCSCKENPDDEYPIQQAQRCGGCGEWLLNQPTRTCPISGWVCCIYCSCPPPLIKDKPTKKRKPSETPPNSPSAENQRLFDEICGTDLRLLFNLYNYDSDSTVDCEQSNKKQKIDDGNDSDKTIPFD
jgi:hypothetical protein